ncbi:LuxR C-terminal-related transcriptional regulator [Chelativorans sp. M5D2P16]|uniref:LuxR C-terminal-related transcriptional regulator n=1 Tax=Chelativorans sp. M5D2P16 TaxID=3095678 RepID=UPI002ACA7769|nr:LuxR C-terminal-related transcriptional regulator [Chelativorans sp. M5D2P16]MDZ5697995.1 LuxR C-terminal-related transcriptional regulator [Chelativorans sp. M5D2P16]
MVETLPPHAFSRLVGSIYDCTLDPSRWGHTLAEIAEALLAQSLILSLNDLRHDHLVIDQSFGWEQHWLEERAQHLPEIHGFLSSWLSPGTSLDEAYVASREIPPERLAASPYVQRCLKPQGITDITHFFLMYTPTHFSEMVVFRHQRQGLMTDREIAIGKLLLPHLRRAVTISRVLDARAIERERMVQALDALACGVVLTDERGAILHSNRAAERMLCEGAAIRESRGVLEAKVPAAARELRNAIRQAACDEAGMGKAGLSVRLTDIDALPLFAHLLPMTGSDLRTSLQPAAVAAVFIGSEPDAESEAEMIARTFGLTRAETRLLTCLLAGRMLAEAAGDLGIAPTTARTHLDNIFLKSGVSRQAELMRLARQVALPVEPSASPGTPMER